MPPLEALSLVLTLALPALCAIPLLLVLRSRGLSRTQVYRIDMLVAMCASWLGSSTLNVLVHVRSSVWMELGARTCFVMMGMLVLLAYAPPQLIRRRLGITGLASDIRRGAAAGSGSATSTTSTASATSASSASSGLNAESDGAALRA